MNTKQACQILGLDPDCRFTEIDVERAFNVVGRALHPKIDGTGYLAFGKAAQARRWLLDALEASA
ncbi:MAG: hypothetical protein AAFY06_00130 [Pseudomonadota bacterium]